MTRDAVAAGRTSETGQNATRARIPSRTPPGNYRASQTTISPSSRWAQA